MLPNLASFELVLASQSPRRYDLLRGLDIPFVVQALPDVDESYPVGLTAGEIPIYVAKKKADAYQSLLTDKTILITADTIVWIEDQVFGKPANESEAIQMLQQLSGKTHHVFTGVCIRSAQKQVVFIADTEVRFAELTDKEIRYYVEDYHPLDKAGSYGVQEWIGYIAVESIHGSFYNVMGLPIHQLYEELKKW
jgi:septum formation protein